MRISIRNRIAPTLIVAVIVTLLHVTAVVSGSSAQQPNTQEPNTGSIEGTLRNGAGEPVPDASVVLQGSSQNTMETKTDVRGKFSFSHCPLDTYSIRASKAGLGASAIASLKLAAPGKNQIDLILGTNQMASPDSAKGSSVSAAGQMKFDEQPNFVIAGVKDWSNADLHGSAANAQTSESLNRDTMALNASDTTADRSPKAGEAEGHRLAGQRFEKAGDPFAAQREYEAAVRLNPSEENYFNWGAELLLHKANQPAVEVFTRGTKAHPKSWRMRAGLGAALYASNSPEDAAQRLCEATDLSPSTPVPYIFLGQIEKESVTPLPCSVERLARFAREQPENAKANYYYAIALWKRSRSSDAKNVKPAEALLAKAVTLDPVFAEAHLQLGILQSGNGELQRAVAAYRKATDLNPGLTEAHRRLALAYKRLGDEPKAQQEFAAYQRCEKAETATLEKQHQQLGQFLVILRDNAAIASPN